MVSQATLMLGRVSLHVRALRGQPHKVQARHAAAEDRPGLTNQCTATIVTQCV